MNTASRHHGDTDRAQHIDHSTTHGAFSIPVQGEVGTVSAGDRRLGPDLGLVRLTAPGGLRGGGGGLFANPESSIGLMQYPLLEMPRTLLKALKWNAILT